MSMSDIHAVDDGSGALKYNVSHHDCEDDYDEEEEHTHFYCARCHHTLCLKQIQVPTVQLPDGFQLESVNHVLKGFCPECSENKAPPPFICT